MPLKTFSINKKNEDLLKFIDKQGSLSAYICRLIREDMNKNKMLNNRNIEEMVKKIVLEVVGNNNINTINNEEEIKNAITNYFD